MKTATFKFQRSTSTGYVLVMVLILGAISAVILGSSVTRTIHTATLNERNNQYTVNLSAAEAATEKAIARVMADYQQGGEAQVTANLSQYWGMIPDEDPYWEQFEFSNGETHTSRTYVRRISDTNYVRLESQFCGLYGWASTYRVLSNAKLKSGRYSAVIGAVQQDIQIASIPVFQFAFFYSGLMEFTVARDLIVNGRTHANGDIFLGSAGPVAFNAPVTATGTIQKKDWGGTSFAGPATTTFNSVPDYRTNVACLSLPIGSPNTSSNLHEIIEIPKPGENVNSPLGRERFYNKAGLVLVVSNLSDTNIVITAQIKSSASDTPSYLRWTNSTPYFMDTGVQFKDQREDCWMKTTEIDMGDLRDWIKTNSAVRAKHLTDNSLKILYVADLRSTETTNKTAVRLASGMLLPGGAAGFTVATPNPLYVLGDYNTNTFNTVPAALISDALTILSGNWEDTNGTASVGSRSARSTAVNAAIITGNVPSQGPTGSSPFSGGVLNLVRLLENWNNVVLTLNTSLVCLYESTAAIGTFQDPFNFYYAPTRHFNFDSSFTNWNKLPPGTPMLSALIRAKWASSPPNTTTYASE